MPEGISTWRCPPLFRLTQGPRHVSIALDEAEKNAGSCRKGASAASGKIDVSRFKGLGEMPPGQLKETTMNPETRRLLRVDLPRRDSAGADARRGVDRLVSTLMGKKPELRFGYIRDHAEEVLADLDL